jgi:hypothetical protein
MVNKPDMYGYHKARTFGVGLGWCALMLCAIPACTIILSTLLIQSLEISSKLVPPPKVLLFGIYLLLSHVLAFKATSAQ